MAFYRRIGGGEGDRLPLEHENRLRGQVGHVQGGALFLDQRMLFHQKPAHMREKETPVDVVPGNEKGNLEIWVAVGWT